ncbi:hypothetical protein D3H64_10035, partial [Atopobacter sp. AH10]|uniref:hypothetical protein n=1 Tax=Atopobacter sp. AH10 TaxID=2315861 RepID=UPI000FF56016
VASQITYGNGAKVNTSFVTNLGDAKIWLCQKLNQRLKSVQAKRPALAKYRYPSCVISGALVKKYIDAGIDIKIGRESCARIEKSKLDQQRELGKGVYGGGYFVSKEIASEMERGFERGKIIELEQEKELGYIWKLSDREKDIVGKLK